MNNNTAAITNDSFNLVYEHWGDSSHDVYFVKQTCATNALYAFVAALTQFAISQWIWSCKANSNHHAPVYLVSSTIFLVLWSILTNCSWCAYYDIPLPIGFRVAVPLLAYGGTLLNLIFCWIWSRIFDTTDTTKTDCSTSTSILSEPQKTMLTKEEEKEEEEVEEGDITDPFNPDVTQIEAVPSADALEAGELGQIPEQESDSPITPTPKKKIDYINNIKIFLNCLVIVFHLALYGYVTPVTNTPTNTPLSIFVMVLQSFFMSLFFFFSGYFSPRSLNKKGTYTFLFDKLKRLGIPLLLITYVLGPYIGGGSQYLFFVYGSGDGDTGFHPSLTDVSVAWFTQQLILFNVVFAFACGEGWAPTIECPSLLSFYLMVLMLGILAGVLGLFFNNEFIFPVPMGWKFYPSYIVFFFGGALAQVNNWMDDIMNRNRVIIYGMAIISIVAFVFTFLYGETVPYLFDFFLILQGIPISLAVTVFFHDFFNRKYAVTPFFSKAMYTTYLIQELFPNGAAIKCWLLIMGAVGSDGQSGGLIFAGWIFTSVLALILNWTLGYAIVSIPGVSQVL